MPANDAQNVDLVRWGLSLVVPALACVVPALTVLVGVMIGAWLTGRRERVQRKHAFIEKQLSDFYSPLLGIHKEIRMQGELGVKIRKAARNNWERLCAEAREIGGADALQKLSEDRSSEFIKLIEYDNRQLKEELLPAYQKMATIFRENRWLAEVETQAHFEVLLEFIDLWERWMAKVIPPEIVESLDRGEESLQPFYNHLQQKHDNLRSKLEKGDV